MKEKIKKVCRWGYNGEALNETECDNAFQLTIGTPRDNKMKYCCFCGKRISQYHRDIEST